MLCKKAGGQRINFVSAVFIPLLCGGIRKNGKKTGVLEVFYDS